MRKRNRKQEKWEPPPEVFAPVDPQEFKFCASLMDAAWSGKMPTPSPTKSGLNIQGIGEIRFTDTRFNRGLLAVRRHFRETREEPLDEGRREFIALGNRLITFGMFVSGCLKKKDPRIERYVQNESGGALLIHEALIEAAATAKIGKNGFDSDSFFAIADRLLAGTGRNLPPPTAL